MRANVKLKPQVCAYVCVCACSVLTRVVRAEVDCEDVVAEVRDVIQLSEVALQRAAGETGFVKWSHKTKHKGVQAGRPTNTNTCTQKCI